MEKEGNHKILYKLELLLVKLIPIVVSAFYVLNAILSYYNLDNAFVSIAVHFLFIIFIYVSSYVFKFCTYHRMFIYYIVVHESLAWYDYKYDIPITNKSYLVLHLTLAGIFLFIILYLHVRSIKETTHTTDN